jgi:hypothetical protein
LDRAAARIKVNPGGDVTVQTQPPRRFPQVVERALAALAVFIKEIGRRLERGIGVESTLDCGGRLRRCALEIFCQGDPSGLGLQTDGQAAPGRDPHAVRLARRRPGSRHEPGPRRAWAQACRHAMVLPPLFGGLMGLSLPAKIAVAVGLLAPLGFVMGLPFPLGLARVSDSTPALVPWAWGINGCASVVAAVMASLLAMHVGFTTVLVLALGLYTATPLLLGRSRPAA